MQVPFYRSAMADESSQGSPSATSTQELERQRSAILENIPDMAWLKDRDSRFIAVNRIFLAANGIEKHADVVGKTDFDFSPPELAERYIADDAEVIRSGKSRRVEEAHANARGVVTWIETIKTPICDANGQVIGTAGIARDIAERKRLEESLRLSHGELEARMAERTKQLEAAHAALIRQERLAVLGQLAGGVAHQLRNPIATMMNAMKILAVPLEREILPDDARMAFRMLGEELQHANSVITGLLDFARVRPPERKSTALVDVIDRVLSRETIPPNIRVETTTSRVPNVTVDAGQIQGALAVLVRNACESMIDGGHLKIELSATDAEIILAVHDTGPGLTEEARGRLFEPLRSSKLSGIGLGLVTARHLVSVHGGRIFAAELPPGQGARFEIHLPMWLSKTAG